MSDPRASADRHRPGEEDARTTSTTTLTGDYALDVARTRIGFVARHTMATMVPGRFSTFAGRAHVSADDPEKSTVDLTVQAASIDTGNPRRDRALRDKFLDAANHPVVTVSAGAKAFLDLPRTLEYLETAGVPVLGWRHDDFPAFYTRSSGLPVPHRVETAAEVAAVLGNRTRERSGVLVVVPIPEQAALDAAELDAVIDGALAACDADGITGAAVTPFVLARIGAATEGRSVPANLALAEHNASVAAEIAVAITV